MHYGRPAPRDVLKQEATDGFVIGGGAGFLIRGGHVAAMADLPFWLQLVGLTIGVAAASFVFWLMGINRYFSTYVRIQEDRGHTTITEGPYRVVRGALEKIADGGSVTLFSGGLSRKPGSGAPTNEIWPLRTP